ncbi:MAG: SIS domain-containing protein [Planctomycetota bacterium]
MLGLTHDAPEYLAKAAEETAKLDAAAMTRLSDAIIQRYEAGRFVFVIGNGGSGLNASHFAEDLGKSSIPDEHLLDPDRKRLRVLSLTDNLGWIMAAGNDLGYEHIFTQQLMNYGKAGDLLIAISGSGNSPNILHAVDWANTHGLDTFGLTGYGGGQLKQQQTDGVHVALDDMGMVESLHLLLFHWVLNDVHGRINSIGRHA